MNNALDRLKNEGQSSPQHTTPCPKPYNYDVPAIENLAQGIYPKRCLALHDDEDPSGYSTVCRADLGKDCNLGKGSDSCVMWSDVNVFSEERLAQDLVTVRSVLATEREKTVSAAELEKQNKALMEQLQDASDRLHCYSIDNKHAEVNKLLARIKDLAEENTALSEHLSSSERMQRDALARAIQAEGEAIRLRAHNAENKRRAANGRIRGATDFVSFLIDRAGGLALGEPGIRAKLAEYIKERSGKPAVDSKGQL